MHVLSDPRCSYDRADQSLPMYFVRANTRLPMLSEMMRLGKKIGDQMIMYTPGSDARSNRTTVPRVSGRNSRCM